MIPLTYATTGEPCVIGRIAGETAIRQHLETIGLTVGSTVSLVSSFSGNVIVQVREGRVAIGKDLANKIWIQQKARD